MITPRFKVLGEVKSLLSDNIGGDKLSKMPQTYETPSDALLSETFRMPQGT